MRLSLLVVFLCVVSVSAQAEPVMYTFTGILGHQSYLQAPDGTITDLTGVAFTAKGFADEALSAFGQNLFYATTTYDFGALGSFTTDDLADVYTQNGDNGFITQVGLIYYPNHPAVFNVPGFWVNLPTPVALDDPSAVQTFDKQETMTVRYAPMEARTLTNAVGETFRLSSGLIDHAPLVITSASVRRVPEPATLSLFAVSAACLLKRRRGRQLRVPSKRA